MNVQPLATFPPIWQAHIHAAITALETATEPVLEGDYPALSDPWLKKTVEHCLGELGRVLVKVDAGYFSGYDDRLSERLACEGIGVLRSDDRALLALVILHSIAIPRAKGRFKGRSWLDAEPVSKAVLLASKIPDTRITASSRRLRDAGILRYGAGKELLPGPQLGRLTPATIERLWENLALLAEPDGILAEGIRRKRHTAQNRTAPENPGGIR